MTTPTAGLQDTSSRSVAYTQYTFTATANSTFTLPGGAFIDQVMFKETAGNAVTGGIKIGSTSGGTDIVASQAIGASAQGHVPDANLSIRVLPSRTIIYVQAITAWNNANVVFTVVVGAPA